MSIEAESKCDECSLIKEYYRLYLEQCNVADKLKIIYKKGRRPNFPEMVSEYISKQISNNITKPNRGDLVLGKNIKIEVKGFSSDGPISFGPTEKWDILILLDMRKQPKFTLYIYKIKSDDIMIQNLKVSKSESFGESCVKGKRPRITPNILLKHLKNPLEIKSSINIVLDGKLPKIII